MMARSQSMTSRGFHLKVLLSVFISVMVLYNFYCLLDGQNDIKLSMTLFQEQVNKINSEVMNQGKEMFHMKEISFGYVSLHTH